MAAPLASATPARYPERWSKPSPVPTWWPRRCSQAIATSKDAFHPYVRANFPGLAPPCGGLPPGRHGGTSTWLNNPWASISRVSRSTLKIFGLPRRKSRRLSPAPCCRRCLPSATPTYSAALPPGRASRPAKSELFGWDPDSTYIQEPPFFQDLSRSPGSIQDIHGARPLAILGDVHHYRPHLPGRRHYRLQPGG